MRIFLILVAIMGCWAVYDEPARLDEDEQQLESLMFFNETGARRIGSLSLSALAQRKVRSILKQMPCGWPKHGIPALAPYKKEYMNFTLNTSLAEDLLLELFDFRLDGLNQMDIVNLKVSYFFKKFVNYHFNFKKLNATALYHYIQTRSHWLAPNLVNKGLLEITLKNLSLQGSFKYKAPLFTGSSEIYDFNIKIALDKITSNSEQIALLVPKMLSERGTEFSNAIKEFWMPRVNEKLKNKTFWHIISYLRSLKPNCPPTTAFGSMKN